MTVNQIIKASVTDVVHFVAKLPLYVVGQLFGTIEKDKVDGLILAEETQVIGQFTTAIESAIVTYVGHNSGVLFTDVQTAILPAVDTIAKAIVNKATGGNNIVGTVVLNYVNSKANALLTTAFATVIDTVTGTVTPAAKAQFAPLANSADNAVSGPETTQ